ncbi:hypothetical protein L6R49_04635 [Myxococcota bacterium]|nr:hypothetical protein [Myxococcota bacterium]
MDTFTLGLGGLGLLSVGLVACGVYARSLTERLHALQTRHADHLAELDQVQAQLREELRRGDDLQTALGALVDRNREISGRADREAAARGQLEGALQNATAAHDRRARGLESQLQLAERNARENGEQLESARRHLRVASATLAALGVPPMDQVWSPVAATARPASRAAIRALILDGQALAVCVADPRGLPLLLAGEPDRADGLAAWSAALTPLEAPVGELFGAPMASLTVVTPTRAMHRLALPVGALRLCLEGPEAIPELAMRLAAAKICGQPGLSPERLRLAEGPVWGEPIDGDPALLDWARGQGASAAWVLDAQERPLLSTVQPTSPPRGLRAALAPLLQRAQRDDLPLDRVELLACADDGRCLGMRLTDDRLDAPLIIALSATRLAPGALDSLDAAVRWRLSTTSMNTAAAGAAR